ncbi:MAG: ABC transporter substrate-binding protein [Desulfobacterales bacterium]
MIRSLPKAACFDLLLLVTLLGAWGCAPGGERAPAGPPQKLILAVSPATYSVLIAVADDKGYFNAAGLEVSIKLYPAGRQALEAVVRGEAQVATVADIAFAAKALEEPSLRILASIATTVGSRIIARRDRGIQVPADLKGKRVGFTADTVSDYFLYAFLLTENISPSDILYVKLPANRQVEAVVSGEVDAVSAFEIFAFEATRRLGENAVAWSSQNTLEYHWLLATTADSLRTPEPLTRLIKALIMAENFVGADEGETQRILVRKWNFDPAFLRESWRQTRVGVSFGQSIVTSLQNYVRWEMNKEGNSAAPRDVLDFLYTRILDEVAPGSVTVFR